MTCPHLRQVRMRMCTIAPFRAMVPVLPAHTASEPCARASDKPCPLGMRIDLWPGGPCRWLGEATVETCAAVPYRIFIPLLANLASPCRTPAHRRCSAFIDPLTAGPPATDPPLEHR